MRILVTGGAGFIGSAVVRRLIGTTEHSVLNIDKLTYAASAASLAAVEANPRYAFRRIDICDKPALDRCLPRFPADRSHASGRREPCRQVDRRTRNLHRNEHRRYAARAGSSSRALGESRQGRSGEVPFPPHLDRRGLRRAFQRRSTLLARLLPTPPAHPTPPARLPPTTWFAPGVTLSACPSLVTNCTNNYGPYHFPEKLIPLMIIKALKGEPLPVYGHGDNVRDWLHVEDHAEALLTVLERGEDRRDLPHRRRFGTLQS